MLRWTCELPPQIVSDRDQRKEYKSSSVPEPSVIWWPMPATSVKSSPMSWCVSLHCSLVRLDAGPSSLPCSAWVSRWNEW